MPLSGPEWVNQYPTSSRIEDLNGSFRSNVQRFVAALRAAGATVTIAATLRPPERAYLMHYAYAIARQGMDPNTVPPMYGVDIEWVHHDAQGRPNILASQAAANEMVQGFGIVFQPALTSRHTEGRAIDMDITWSRNLTIRDGSGAQVTITSQPRTGAGNADLQRVGASFGVYKLATDPPHWSSDGH
jgi:hypothetical protein